MKFSHKLILASGLLVIIGSVVYLSRLNTKKKEAVKNESSVIRVVLGQFPSALTIANENGYFAEEGIQVQKENIPNLNLTIEALGRGDVDVAAINYSTLFAYQNVSPDKFIIFYGSIETKDNPYTLLIAKENIKSPRDLAGKKIAIRTGVQSEVEAKTVLKAMGLDLKKVELVVGETNFLATALNQPEISAVMAPESYATVILQKGLGVVLVKAPRAEYIFDPYPTAAGVLSAQLVKNHPDLAKKIKVAVDKAIDFMNSNEQESRKIFQNSLGLDEGVAMDMNLGINLKLEETDRKLIGKLIDFQVENKLLEKRPDFSNVYYQE